MSKFDNEEQNMYDMLSQITVNPSKLAEQVKSRLHEEGSRVATKHRRYWAKSAVAAMIMSAMLVVTVAATVGGGFDWFIGRFNPSFGKVVEPVEVYSEDQGIRMEVIGAQKYDNKAIIYLSLQDVTGQNRLTEQTQFRDGFGVKMNLQAQKAAKKAGEDAVGSFSWRQNMLYFNEDTNTVYYEFNVTADSDTPLADPLQLGSSLIYFDERAYQDEPISISLAEIGPAEITPIQENQIWGGWGAVSDDRSSFTKALTPGQYADMPHGEKDQWVSNIGMVDGKLHVQIGKIFNKEFGSSDAQLSLKDPGGKIIPSDFGLVYFSDGNNHLLDLNKDGYSDAIYKYEEAIFSVNTEDLSGYTLCYTGSVYSGVEGSWNVKANLSDPNQNMAIWTNDIPVESHLFEHITLSPLGLQVIGTYEGEECLASNMVIEVKTTDGIIPLEGGGGSQNSEKHTFNLSWNTEIPLDVSTVTAVIINGTRIPAH